MERQRLHTLIGLGLAFAFMAGLVVVRAGLVDYRIGTYIACPGCFHFAVAAADLPLFSLLAGLFLAAGWLRPIWLGRSVHVLAGGLFVIYVADLFVFRLFNSRLFLSDAALFVSERTAVWNQFSGGVGGTLPALGIGIALIGLLAALWWVPPVRPPRLRLLLGSILLGTLTAGSLTDDLPYVNNWAVDNVFAANLATPERTRYTSAEATRIEAARQPPVPVESSAPAGPGRGRNVIVVLLESWSSWHSRLFGGLEDWTPELDAAAARGTRFTRFHSIGFSTDKGLVGILAGQPVWSPFLNWFETPPFHSMWGIPRTLPSVFNDAGHATAFLTSGPLTLYRKGEWLADLGFGEVEGNEHEFYADLPRFAFGAASDRALYQRAEQWRAGAKTPYLLVLETVSTHQPYTDPDSGERSLEKAMRYADRAFGDYLEALGDDGYFADGILLVVSDHRSMTPIPAEEFTRFGDDAHSRVPAFALGAGFAAGADDRVYSQSDLVPSFELWLSGRTLLAPFQGVMFGEPQSAAGALGSCAFHARGDRRALVEVVCQEGRGQVVLDGDRTRFTRQQGLEAEVRALLLQRIAELRLEGLARHEDREGT